MHTPRFYPRTRESAPAYLDTHFFFFHLDHLLRKNGVFMGVPLSEVRRLQCCGFGLWGHNPMLAITVDSRFPFAVSPECSSCPCFFSGVVSLPLRKRGHRKIISHSDGHSVVNRQNKKTDTQRYQKSAGTLLSLQNDETMYRL